MTNSRLLSWMRVLGIVALAGTTGCTPDVKVKSVRLLEPGGRVKASASVGVVVEVDDPGGAPLEFKWTSTRGTFHEAVTKAPSNIYTAPPRGGVDTITVEVVGGKAPARLTIQTEVAEPASADAPASASSQAASIEPPVVSIAQPAADSTVAPSALAHGTARGGSSAAHLWVVINPIGEPGWWPQGGPLAPVPPRGDWDQQVSFGGSAGQRFRMAVVLASDAAHRAFSIYLEEGERTGKYPGKPLPAGATILTSVDVVKGR